MSYFFAIFISVCVILTLYRYVDWLGLVDRPCDRKKHVGNIPLIGGLSVFISYALSILIFTNPSNEVFLFVIASSLMVYIGVLDDKYDLSVRSRLIGQFIVSSLLIFGLGIYIKSLGDILFLGDINLAGVGVAFTFIFIVGAINAFNMIDGIDGLLGSISITSFCSLGFLGFYYGNTELFHFSLLFACCLIPFLFANLGLFPFKKMKIFMGDAGSMFIGFALLWLLIVNVDQNNEGLSYRPIVGLYIIGLPLIDMIALMFRRVKKGKSPFKADREHIHHIFLKSGFSSKQTLLLLWSGSSLFALLGLCLEVNNASEGIMFFIFIASFIIYTSIIMYAWKFSRFINQFKSKVER